MIRKFVIMIFLSTLPLLFRAQENRLAEQKGSTVGVQTNIP